MFGISSTALCPTDVRRYLLSPKWPLTVDRSDRMVIGHTKTGKSDFQGLLQISPKTVPAPCVLALRESRVGICLLRKYRFPLIRGSVGKRRVILRCWIRIVHGDANCSIRHANVFTEFTVFLLYSISFYSFLVSKMTGLLLSPSSGDPPLP